MFKRILCCIVLLGFGMTHAQTSYVHDADGRVVAVTQSNGTSTQYSYDALGHVGQISAPISAGQLAIFAFVPTHGEAGAQVTIQGQGFDSNAANDTVSFNGTVATVLSASATQLVTMVPNGATTGPISVTVGGQTVASAALFSVDDTGVPPTITQVTPVVAVGGTVTVAGTHLDPIIGDTAVRMGDMDVSSLSSITDSQIQYTMLSNAVSSWVTVTTPYGEATSATPVALLPSSVISAITSISASYLPSNGSVVSVGTQVAGQTAVLTFDAHQGDNLELEFTDLNVAGGSQNQVAVQIYSPTGASLVNFSCNGSAATNYCHQPLWNVPTAGTYSIVVTPTGGGTMNFNALLQADVIGPALTPSTSLAVNLSAGQMERVTFNATAGQTVALSIAGVNTAPSGQFLAAFVYTPGTSALTMSNYYTFIAPTSSGILNLPNLPASGTYTVIIGSANSVPVSAQLTLVPGVTGTLPSDGTNQSYTTSASGQNAYLNFTANAGDNLELELVGVNVTGGSQNQANVQVSNAAGTVIASVSCPGSATTNYCHQPLWNLAAGTYSIVVSPANGGTLTFNALLQPDVIGPSLTANTPLAVNLGAGQMERITFTATAGQTVALSIAGVSTAPSGQFLAAIVYSPSVGTITPNDYYVFTQSTSSGIFNLPNLPVGGTYTVVIGSGNSVPVTGQLTLVPGVTGTLPSDGTTQSYSTSVSGLNTYLNFTASAGDNLELELVGVNVTGGSQNQANVQVSNAAGNVVASLTCPGSATTTNYCHEQLWNMAAGTYVITVSPSNGGTMSFNVLLPPDVIGPALTANTPLDVNLTAGQMERVTFAATAGQTVTLSISGVSTTPAGQFMAAIVYSPSVGTITPSNSYTLFSATSSNSLTLSNLPVSGTYTVVIGAANSVPVTGQLTLVPQ